MRSLKCLSDESLDSLLTGRLSGVEAEAIESHLLSCPECVERTRGLLTADSLVAVLPAVASVAWSENEEAAVQELLDRLRDSSRLVTLDASLEPTRIDRRDQPERSASAIEDAVGQRERENDAGMSGGSQASSDSEFLTQAPSVGGSLLSDRTVTEMPALPSEGALLGFYRLERKLGAGGMGEVWKAFHTKLRKPVALKSLPAHLMRDAGVVARFEREMEAVGRLDHPSIVRAMDAGEIHGIHYLAMEYVDGVDLGQLVERDGPLTAKVACELLSQAATALAYAHRQGLVHRDIKPPNLILTKDGMVKVLDLGLARLQEDTLNAAPGAELTGESQILGTPDYMAPEQWENTHVVGPACDLYALGCTLFYLLTGRAPFGDAGHRTLPKKMKGHLEEPAPDLLAARAAVLANGFGLTQDIPPALDAIYRRLLAKAPAERFVSAEDLAAALQEVARSFLHNTPTKPGSAAIRPVPPNPLKRLALGGLGAAMLAATIIITIRHKDGTESEIRPANGAEVIVKADPGEQVEVVFGSTAGTPAPQAPSGSPPKPLASRVAPPSPAPVDFASERKAAIGLIELRTRRKLPLDVRLRLEKSGTLAELPQNAAALPAEPFTVSQILFGRNLTDEDLAPIGACRHLEGLDIGASRQLSDAGLRQLRPLRSLRWVAINECPLLKEEIPTLLASNPQLYSVGINGTAATSASIRALGACPRLRQLHVSEGAMTPEVYRFLAEHCRELRTFEVHGGKVSGVDVSALASLPFLRELAIGCDLLTPDRADATVAALTSMPSLESLILLRVASGDDLARVAPLGKRLRRLTVADAVSQGSVGPQFWKPLSEFTALESLGLLNLKGMLDGPSLLRMANLPALRALSLTNVQVENPRLYTAADLAEFRRRRPDVTLTDQIGNNEVKTYPPLEHYPRGTDGRSVAEWNLPQGAPAPAVVPFTPEEATAHQEAWARFAGQPVEVENSLGMKFRLIPPGQHTVRIHGNGQLAGKRPENGPELTYRLTQPYHLGATEVTVAQFRKFLVETSHKPTGTQPGGQTHLPNVDGTSHDPSDRFWEALPFELHDDDPAPLVSQADATAFCEWLSKKEGAAYRLPTECEWFFACAAGGEKRFGFVETVEELREYAWDRSSLTFPFTKTNSPLHPVATRKPNPFGLYDILGNVLELARDRLSTADNLATVSPINPTGQIGAFASHCGGAWMADADSNYFSPVFRGNSDISPSFGYSTVGFRVLKELPAAKPLPKPLEGPVLVQPGLPLTPYALVGRPASIPGVRSWTIEPATHNGVTGVHSNVWSPRGDLVATCYGAGDHSVRLWDRNGNLQRVLLPPYGKISSLSFSHDGTLLAGGIESAPNRGAIIVWEVATGLTRAVISVRDSRGMAAFSPVDHELALREHGDALTLLNLDSGRYRTFGGQKFMRMAWAPDGRSLFTGNAEGEPAVWRPAAGAGPTRLETPDGKEGTMWIECVSWSPDGKWIAAADAPLVRVWNAETRALHRSIETSFSGISTVAWSRDNRRLMVSGLGDDAWWIVDALEGTRIVQVKALQTLRATNPVAWSPDETEVATWDFTANGLIFCDPSSGKTHRRGPSRGTTMGWLGPPSADGRTIYGSGSRKLFAFDSATGELVRDIPSSLGAFPYVAGSPSGRRLLCWGEGSYAAHILDAQTGKVVQKLQITGLKPEENKPWDVAWSPDDRFVAMAGADRSIRIWNAENSRLAH